jgi:hypothetical protein
MPRVVPLSVGFFGDATFQKDFLVSALAAYPPVPGRARRRPPRRLRGGRGRGGGELDAVRARHGRDEGAGGGAELGPDERQPEKLERDLRLPLGPPKASTRSTRRSLGSTLAEGQEPLLREEWPAETAAQVAALLGRGRLLLLHDALARAADAPGSDLDAAQAAATGTWLAGAEPVLAADPALANRIQAALTGTPDPFALKDARDDVAALLSNMTER